MSDEKFATLALQLLVFAFIILTINPVMEIVKGNTQLIVMGLYATLVGVAIGMNKIWRFCQKISKIANLSKPKNKKELSH